MTSIPYKTFMQEVRKQLDQKSKEELKELLVHWAARQPASERSGFLDNLIFPHKGRLSKTEPAAVIDSIQALARKVEDGHYCEGWGWDDEISKERSYGDESWVEEAEELFHEAREILVSGKHREAAKAYGMLFETLNKGMESGQLPGRENPYNMLDLDIDEVASLYLRTVYLDSEPAKRPEKLLQEINDLYYICPDIKLERIANALEDELPDYHFFLSAWIEHLHNSNCRNKSALLREAVKLHGGTEAISEFARKYPETYPYAYLDWLEELEKQDDPESVLAVAREALNSIPGHYHARAKAAEAISQIGEKVNDAALALEGYMESFYSNPSAENLFNLYQAAINCGCFETVLSKVNARVQQLVEEHGTATQQYFNIELARAYISENLLTVIQILNGEHEKLVEKCKGKKSLGWTYSDNPKFLVVTYLMELLSQSGSHKTAITKQWKNALASSIKIYNDDQFVQYMAILNHVKDNVSLSNEQETYYLSWCKREVGKRVDGIISNQYRKSYYKAADLIAAMGETLANRNKTNESAAFLGLYKSKYPRHSAFKAELERAVRESNFI